MGKPGLAVFCLAAFNSEEEGTEFLFSCLSVESCQQFASSEPLHYLCECKTLHLTHQAGPSGKVQEQHLGFRCLLVLREGPNTHVCHMHCKGGSVVQPFSTSHSPPTSTLPTSGMESAALMCLSISPASEHENWKCGAKSPLQKVLCSLCSTRWGISLRIVEAAPSVEPSTGALCSSLVTWAGWIFPEHSMEQKKGNKGGQRN